MSRIPEITIKETVDHSNSAKEHKKQRHMLHNSIPVCYIYGETSHNFRYHISNVCLFIIENNCRFGYIIIPI